MGVTELADTLGMSKSIVHKHLRTLKERGYVIANGDKYGLGLRFFQLGGRTRKKMNLCQVAKEKIDKLAVETNSVTNFAVKEGGGVSTCLGTGKPNNQPRILLRGDV